eukprot:c24840_g1_i1 orf=2-391(-)
MHLVHVMEREHENRKAPKCRTWQEYSGELNLGFKSLTRGGFYCKRLQVPNPECLLGPLYLVETKIPKIHHIPVTHFQLVEILYGCLPYMQECCNMLEACSSSQCTGQTIHVHFGTVGILACKTYKNMLWP